MRCAICGFNWCWSCGLSSSSLLHSGIAPFCKIFNSVSLLKMPKLVLVLLLALSFTFSPLILLLGLIFVQLDVYGLSWMSRSSNRNSSSCMGSYCRQLFKIILTLLLILATSCVGFGLLVGPIIIAEICWVTAFIFRWGFKGVCKKTNKNLVEMKTQAMAEDFQENAKR